jgi:small-conductance mechanosensitive channel
MKEFYLNYQNEILGTFIWGLVLFITRTLSIKIIRKVSRIGDMDMLRSRLIIKYVSVGHTILLVIALILIWGVPFQDIGVVLSSVFAVIGVALFASWSILSNITAGVILFFTFPFKIGDKIRILDKDLHEPLECVIEDIRAFYLYLRTSNGELVTYPNNLFLQKAVCLVAAKGSDRDLKE